MPTRTFAVALALLLISITGGVLRAAENQGTPAILRTRTTDAVGRRCRVAFTLPARRLCLLHLKRK